MCESCVIRWCVENFFVVWKHTIATRGGDRIATLLCLARELYSAVVSSSLGDVVSIGRMFVNAKDPWGSRVCRLADCRSTACPRRLLLRHL